MQKKDSLTIPRAENFLFSFKYMYHIYKQEMYIYFSPKFCCHQNFWFIFHFKLGQVLASYLTQLIKAAEDKIWGRENFLAKFRYSAYIWTWGNENPSFSSKVDCSLYLFKTCQIVILSILLKYYTYHYTMLFTNACMFHLFHNKKLLLMHIYQKLLEILHVVIHQHSEGKRLPQIIKKKVVLTNHW